jgi:hypothetical protein
LAYVTHFSTKLIDRLFRRRTNRWPFSEDFPGFDDPQGAPVPRIQGPPSLSGAASVPLPHTDDDPLSFTYVLV